MNDDFKPRRPDRSAPQAVKTHIPVADRSPKPTKVRLHRRVHWWLKSLSRKQFIAVTVLFFLVAGGAGYWLWDSGRGVVRDTVANLTDVPEPPPEPTTVASRMTGVQVEPELNELPVTGVMIENSPDARPQAGLRQANLVYEAIAEGGITRFLALYQESQPDYIGPVRSVRPYFLDFLVPYDAALAHAGGSAAALSQIRSQGIKDLDHGANGGTYERVSGRYAPHNLFTSRGKLLDLQKRKGFTSSDYDGFARKEKATPAETPAITKIDLTISSFLYNPSYAYDVASNTYKRSQGGRPHVDDRNGKQIAPSVVIALVSPHRYEGIYSVYKVTGGGVATIFQDGVAIDATWEKASRKREYIFKNSAGEVIPLNPGQTWITLVGNSGAIKATP